MENFANSLWTFLNSPTGIIIMVYIAVKAVNKIYEKRPLWKQYEGAVIKAIRLVEKEIPNTASPDSGIAKFDRALQYVLKVYEKAKGTPATEAEKADFSNGIELKLLDMEGTPALKKAA